MKESQLGELAQLLQALQGYLNAAFLGLLSVFTGRDFCVPCLPRHVSDKERKVHLDDVSCTYCRSLKNPLVPQLLVLLGAVSLLSPSKRVQLGKSWKHIPDCEVL